MAVGADRAAPTAEGAVASSGVLLTELLAPPPPPELELELSPATAAAAVAAAAADTRATAGSPEEEARAGLLTGSGGGEAAGGWAGEAVARQLDNLQAAERMAAVQRMRGHARKARRNCIVPAATVEHTAPCCEGEVTRVSASGRSVVSFKAFSARACGHYERRPVENGWHRATLSVATGQRLTWRNQAGVAWSCKEDGRRLATGPDCPHPGEDFELRVAEDKVRTLSLKWDGRPLVHLCVNDVLFCRSVSSANKFPPPSIKNKTQAVGPPPGRGRLLPRGDVPQSGFALES